MNIVGKFCDELKELFFDQIPIKPDITDDVFLLFGKISIACCRTALFQFDYRKFISHDKMYDDCLAYIVDFNCTYFLDKKVSSFNSLCSIQHELYSNQMQIYKIICCDCYFDLCFFLLRRKVNFDEMHNRFNNLCDCYYAVAYNTMIVSCYKILRFEISSNDGMLTKGNCFEKFLKQNDSRLCILCINDLFFFLSEKMNEFSLRE